MPIYSCRITLSDINRTQAFARVIRRSINSIHEIIELIYLLVLATIMASAEWKFSLQENVLFTNTEII